MLNCIQLKNCEKPLKAPGNFQHQLHPESGGHQRQRRQVLQTRRGNQEEAAASPGRTQRGH